VKTKNGILKYILKKAVRGLIPDELVNRKKQGFGVPVYEWSLGQLGKKTQEEIQDFSDQSDLLDRNEALCLINRGRSSEAWYLLNFILWWKEFIK
jgi:asparagine synthase (glutamine-hydrolysing)